MQVTQRSLPLALKQQMLEHALQHPQLEACGLIGGVAGLAKSYYPIENIADDPAHRFLMEPQQQISAMRKMRDRGETLSGIFHSHPDTAAEPSANDLELASYPDVIYFIASLAGKTPAFYSYHYDGISFNKVSLV